MFSISSLVNESHENNTGISISVRNTLHTSANILKVQYIINSIQEFETNYFIRPLEKNNSRIFFFGTYNFFHRAFLLSANVLQSIMATQELLATLPPLVLLRQHCPNAQQ